MIEKIGNVKLNLSYYNGKDEYSDGDIENELLEIAKNNDSFEDVIYESDKWPLIYHLSKQRQNILEWYDFKGNETLLEVGAGCGAITELFLKKLKKVVAIEISKKRSLINANRNKKYKNLEIMVGNLNDIEISEKFDYITLIGVLEYSKGFTISETPEITFLKNLKKHLKPNGKIIIAIENKFGLKYWAGAREDHTGKYFNGIQGYLDIETVATYSKTELEDILKKVGLTDFEFYYPLPDYKMPEVIFSDNYLPKIGDLRNLIHNYDMSRYILFDEGVVYDQLIKDKNFEKFSNSFLVVSKNKKIEEKKEIEKEVKKHEGYFYKIFRRWKAKKI
ncbi:methyltransferase [Leptotrichia trevisanii]|uniref:Methyltransferase n=1 Tax=Leptotrichia trevisanii TaxID=109328 RepID=A0A510KHL6_9FUSO|nr:class I SAM-dependent methyltransferase [Leptotrichia trevisanii]BBM51178.1 methyltransferase [Leptotrichia trevisanii]